MTRPGLPRRYIVLRPLSADDMRSPVSFPKPIKTVNSLLTLQTNDAHQVTYHTEEWDHKRETTRDDGFLGYLNEQRKKITAGVTGMFVSQEPPEGASSK